MDKLIELGGWNDNTTFDLLYRASRDGFNSNAFHELCDNHENTILVVKSTTGYVFGGFTTQTWNREDLKQNIYKNDSKAFLIDFLCNRFNKLPVLLFCCLAF